VRPCLNKTLHKKEMAERLKEYTLTSSPSSAKKKIRKESKNIPISEPNY
jgi:hypothetical protein